MSASTDALPVRNDFAVISLVGFVHAVSHFYHLVIPLLFPWLMPAFDMNFTEAGALMTVFFIISGVGQALTAEDPQKRRLAGAVGTDDADTIPALDTCIYITQYLVFAEALA